MRCNKDHVTSHAHILRSHAVLQVTVEASRIAGGAQQEVQTGRLYMVDLAGSERAAQTQVYREVLSPAWDLSIQGTQKASVCILESW